MGFTTPFYRNNFFPKAKKKNTFFYNMAHIKIEPLSEPKYMTYMPSIPSTSTTIPGFELFETQQKVEYHDKLFKMEKGFEKLHLNARDETEFFKDKVIDIQQQLFYNKYEDESGKTILKCKICYKIFKCS